MLTFRSQNDLDFSLRSQLYLLVFCILLILSNVGILHEINKENNSNSPSLAASIGIIL